MNPIHQSVDTTWTFQSQDLAGAQQVASPFTHHHLQPANPVPVQIIQQVPDWIPVIIILCLILIAWVNVFFPKRFRQLLAAPLSRRNLNILMKEGNLFHERIFLVLGFVYLLVFSLLIYQTTRKLFPDLPPPVDPWMIFGIFFLFLCLFWLMKTFVVRVLQHVFKTRKTTTEYLMNMLVFSISNAILLIPFLIFSIYLPSRIPLYLALAVTGILFILRFMRGFFIGLSLRKFSYLFLFVYLCTLEILPLLFLVKVILDLSGIKQGID